jgi:hypothetical protein
LTKYEYLLHFIYPRTGQESEVFPMKKYIGLAIGTVVVVGSAMALHRNPQPILSAREQSTLHDAPADFSLVQGPQDNALLTQLPAGFNAAGQTQKQRLVTMFKNAIIASGSEISAPLGVCLQKQADQTDFRAIPRISWAAERIDEIMWKPIFVHCGEDGIAAERLGWLKLNTNGFYLHFESWSGTVSNPEKDDLIDLAAGQTRVDDETIAAAFQEAAKSAVA